MAVAGHLVLARADGTDEQLVHTIRLLRGAVRQVGAIERATGFRCRYLPVKAGLHGTTWSSGPADMAGSTTSRCGQTIGIRATYMSGEIKGTDSETRAAHATEQHSGDPGGEGRSCGGGGRRGATVANPDFTEANVHDLVYTIITPTIREFRCRTRYNLRLAREKTITSIDGRTGGKEECVAIDIISLAEKKFVLIVEAKVLWERR